MPARAPSNRSPTTRSWSLGPAAVEAFTGPPAKPGPPRLVVDNTQQEPDSPDTGATTAKAEGEEDDPR
jgi:hypothetical protein